MSKSKRRQQELVRCIDPSEGEYLGKARAQYEEGVRLEQQAAQLEQQAADLRQQALARYGALASYEAYLCERYGLNQGTDQIDHATLAITRAPTPMAASASGSTPSMPRPKKTATREGEPPTAEEA